MSPAPDGPLPLGRPAPPGPRLAPPRPASPLPAPPLPSVPTRPAVAVTGRDGARPRGRNLLPLGPLPRAPGAPCPRESPKAFGGRGGAAGVRAWPARRLHDTRAEGGRRLPGEGPHPRPSRPGPSRERTRDAGVPWVPGRTGSGAERGSAVRRTGAVGWGCGCLGKGPQSPPDTLYDCRAHTQPRTDSVEGVFPGTEGSSTAGGSR